MDPNKEELIRKLKDDQPLTFLERAFLANLLEDSNHHELKRINKDDSVLPQVKKIKVEEDVSNQIAKITACTQTYGLGDGSSPNISITAKDIVTQSKKLVDDTMDAAIATDLMAKSFDKRRNFILIQRPMARFVKEKYPLLFSNAQVQNEIDRIFYAGKCTEFFENIQKCAPHILSMAKHNDPLLLATKNNKTQGLKTVAERKYAEEVGALLMISSHMKEKINFLKLIDKSCRPGDFPFIECQAKLNDLYSDQHIFKIFVEGIMLCEAKDFKEAILCLIASYFIFNITYPRENFNTLVAFEKLFLESNDTDDRMIDLAARQIIQSIQCKCQVC